VHRLWNTDHKGQRTGIMHDIQTLLAQEQKVRERGDDDA
jgi:hypothetical protein